MPKSREWEPPVPRCPQLEAADEVAKQSILVAILLARHYLEHFPALLLKAGQSVWSQKDVGKLEGQFNESNAIWKGGLP